MSILVFLDGFSCSVGSSKVLHVGGGGGGGLPLHPPRAQQHQDQPIRIRNQIGCSWRSCGLWVGGHQGTYHVDLVQTKLPKQGGLDGRMEGYKMTTTDGQVGDQVG